MLKKASHIILALLVMLTTMSTTISRHYCGTTLKSVSINNVPQHCCDIPGCCHDESISIEVKDDFSPTSIIFDFSQFAFDLPVLSETFNIASFDNNVYYRFYCTPSPPKIQQVLAILQTYLL